MNELIYGIDQIESAAKLLISKAGNKKIWLFKGEIGAGKTTLIKKIAELLGSQDDFSSPTFGLIHPYSISNSNQLIYHIDFYRINHELELNQLGMEEIFNSGDFVFVEWPEIASGYIPDNHFDIEIVYLDELIRKVIFL